MLSIALLFLMPLGAVVAEPVSIGAQKVLFIDDRFVESAHGVALRVRPATKTGERTLEPDKPWESASLNWFNVIERDGDTGSKYAMWYEAYDVEGWPTGDDTSFCYAESADGVHWTKPGLALSPYHDIKETNVLFRMIGPTDAHSRVHGTGVFLDPGAPPAERYKAVSQGQFPKSGTPPQRIAGMYSPDGIHWTRYPELICNVFADSQYSGFWDSRIARYVVFGRVSGRGRSIGRAASADFAHLEPLERVLETFDGDGSQRDVYNPAAVKYPFAEHVYFMFPSIYRHDTDTLDIALAVSRDGIAWTWPDPATPFIPLSPVGSFDSGSLYMGQGIVQTGDGLSMYFSGSPLKHNEAELPNLTKPGNERIFSRVTLPMDRFVAVAAEAEEGDFATPPLLFQGTRLMLNAEVGKGGSVRVGLLDERDEPVPGRSLNDCQGIEGDHIDATVLWKDSADVSFRASVPTRLAFRLKNARIYAFQFAASSVERL